MKSPRLATVFLGWLLLVAAGASSPMVGRSAPDFALVDDSDAILSMSDFVSKTSVVLVFYLAST
jgi:peroxiredoxin